MLSSISDTKEFDSHNLVNLTIMAVALVLQVLFWRFDSFEHYSSSKYPSRMLCIAPRATTYFDCGLIIENLRRSG